MTAEHAVEGQQEEGDDDEARDAADLEGMDGLIHISELSWSHVNHPSEVLEIGQTVNVKVLDIDRERQRISLGLKQTQSDPWQQVLDHYGEGDVVEGRVTKVVTFGAFVEILPGVEGLVHISELANHHVENPREVVSQGDPVNVLILEIDGDRRRLSLSLKRVEEGTVPVPRADGGESVHSMPDLRLSEEAFPSSGAAVEAVEDAEVVVGAEDEIAEGSLTVEEADAPAEPEAEAEPDVEVEAEAEADAEVEAEAEVEDEAEVEAEAEVERAEAEVEVEAEVEPRSKPRFPTASPPPRRTPRSSPRQRAKPSPSPRPTRPRASAPPDRGRDHGGNRRRQVHCPRGIPVARCRDRLERRDRPPPARGRRRGARRDRRAPGRGDAR